MKCIHSKALLLAACLVLTACESTRVCRASDVKFTAMPAAVKSSAATTITFTLAAPTDVEVAVLRADGKVIRHLAAGVLGGKNPPPGPLKPGLAQSLVWDGKDDAGKPADGGAFKVRVRAGTHAALGGFLGYDPYRMPFVHGLATDEKGNLHVLFRNEFNHGFGPMRMRVFSRDGKYARTLMPYSAELPAEKVAAFGQLSSKGATPGVVCPANYDPLTPKLYPMNTDDDMALMGHRIRGDKISLLLPNDGGVVEIARDGSATGKAFEVAQVWGRYAQAKPDLHRPATGGFGPMTFARSPDGKTLYIAGFEAPAKPTAGLSWESGRIHKVDLSKPLLPTAPGVGVLPAETFASTQSEGAMPAGQGRSDWGLYVGLANVMGLDVGDDGTVYACDRGNKRLAAYDPHGKLLDSIAVEDADAVAVNSKTNELYVLTRKQPVKTTLTYALIKYSSLKDGKKELARLAFKDPGSSCGALALDISGGKPVLWVAGPGGPNRIWRIEDQGSTLQISGELSQSASPEGLNSTVYCYANPTNDQVFVHDGTGELTRLDGLTGKILPGWKNDAGRPSWGLEAAFDLAGNVYLSGYGVGSIYMSHVTRFSPEMQQLTLGSSAKETGGKEVYGRYGVGNSQKGLAVGPDGRIYANHMLEWNKYVIGSWKPDGTPDQPEVFAVGATYTGTVKVDLQNNIYFGLTGVLKDYAGAACHGSVIKVSADKTKDAGLKAAEPGLPWVHGVLSGSSPMGFMHGAAQVYGGLAPMTGRPGSCGCKEARFDLDKFGRLYIPNTLTFSVQVVDNSGNEILTLGRYGNADFATGSESKDSPTRKSEIPLGWPMTVAATDSGHVYVGDVLNTRVVRVDLKYAAEETVVVK